MKMGWVTKNAASGRALSAAKNSCLLGVVALATIAAKPAQGALTMTLSEPGYTTVTGNVSGNTDSYIGSFGSFTTNIVVGYSNSGTSANPAQLQIQSLDVTNTAPGGGVLTIVFTDNGFTFPGTAGTNLLMTSTLGGTFTPPVQGDSVSFQSFATPAGGSTTSTSKQTFVTPVTNGSTMPLLVPISTATFVGSGAFTLSNTIIASLSGAGETANLSGSTTVTTAAVPEPVGISAIAVAGLAFGRRRRAS